MGKAERTVEELVSKIERGEIRLPEMQRRCVWKKTRVRDLLDSLYRGYPSGAILLWETDEEVSPPTRGALRRGSLRPPLRSRRVFGWLAEPYPCLADRCWPAYAQGASAWQPSPSAPLRATVWLACPAVALLTDRSWPAYALCTSAWQPSLSAPLRAKAGGGGS